MRTVVYLHCMAKINDSTSQKQFDECHNGINIDMLVSNTSKNALSNSFGKGSQVIIMNH